MSVTRSLDTKRRDGSTFTHIASFVRYIVEADGIVAVECVCCANLPDSNTSRHTLPFDVGSRSEAEILAEINDHLDRMTAIHAARQMALDYLEFLAPTPQPVAPARPPQPLTSNSGPGTVP